MTLYMLDTNAASEAVRGHPEFDERLKSLPPGQWCISAVTRSEIRFGVANKPEAVRLHRIVDEFLRIVPVLPWDAKAAKARRTPSRSAVARPGDRGLRRNDRGARTGGWRRGGHRQRPALFSGSWPRPRKLAAARPGPLNGRTASSFTGFRGELARRICRHPAKPIQSGSRRMSLPSD
jgi:predicted nucleic acid-binding protein